MEIRITGTTELIKSIPPNFIETESARRMLLALRRARAKAKLTMISGTPGVGKSKTVKHFKEVEALETLVFQATSGEGGVWNLACALFNMLELGVPNVRNIGDARRKIAEKIRFKGFLIIDEAQYLVQTNKQTNGRGADNFDCFEWARSLAETGGFGLAFVGDKKLDEIVFDLPQLKRRTHPRITIPHVTDTDTEIFCNAYGLTDKDAIHEMGRVAQKFGGLGDMTEVFTTASDMSEGRTGVPDDIYAALELLGFSIGGV